MKIHKSFVVLILTSQLLFADDLSDYTLSLKHQGELNQVIRQGIKKLRNNESSTIKDLRTIESNISKRLQKITQLDRDIAKLKKQQRVIQQSLDEVNNDVTKHRNTAITRMQFFYKISHQNTAKIIFSHLDKTNTGKLSAWYKYLLNNQIKTIGELKIKIQQKEIMQENLSEKQFFILTKINQQEATIAGLKKYQNNTKNLLVSLRKDLKSDLGLLQQGQADYDALQFMLDKITGTVRKITIGTEHSMSFTQLKGKLHYPSEFEHFKSDKSLVFIAPDNSEVKSIYDGRVIFSDWMRGYGLLTIVDHGEGFMSLYGRNKILFKDRGEWISTGEVLAKVGDTGGIVGNGLFFELRHNNQPISTKKWFNKN